jgi:SAM-dependent methyltransferase
MSFSEPSEFFLTVKQKFPDYFDSCFVIDIGALGHKANHQELFVNCLCLGVDVFPGDNVHIISKGCELNLPSEIADVIVYNEYGKHDKLHKKALKNILRLLKPGGFLMFIIASTKRDEHRIYSTHLEGSLSKIQFQDYKNLRVDDLKSIVNFEDVFENYEFFINDDGSHMPEHQILSFNTLFPSLCEGGVYIIEDIETSYWTRGGLYGYQTRYGYKHPNSIIEIFKEVADSVNTEFAGKHQNRVEHHESIGSITFSRNCIIITKKTQKTRKYRLSQCL